MQGTREIDTSSTNYLKCTYLNLILINFNHMNCVRYINQFREVHQVYTLSSWNAFQLINHMKCIYFTYKYMKCIMHMLYHKDTWNAFKSVNHMRCITKMLLHYLSPKYFPYKDAWDSRWYFTNIPFNKRYLIYHKDTLARYFQ